MKIKFFFSLITFFLVLMIGLFFVLPVLAEPVQLETTARTPNIQINIGDFSAANFKPYVCPEGSTCPIGWIGQYIGVVYQYGVGLAAVLATVMIMAGGFLWLTSGGSPDRVGKAKEFIAGSLTGLLLALFSFMILYTVNPELVKLTPISPRRPIDASYILAVQRFLGERGVDVNETQQALSGLDSDLADQILSEAGLMTMMYPRSSARIFNFFNEHGEFRDAVLNGQINSEMINNIYQQMTQEDRDDFQGIYRAVSPDLLEVLNNYNPTISQTIEMLLGG